MENVFVGRILNIQRRSGTLVSMQVYYIIKNIGSGVARAICSREFFDRDRGGTV